MVPWHSQARDQSTSNRIERSEVKSVILLNARITRRHAVMPLVSALIQEVSEYKAIHQFFRRSNATNDTNTASHADTHNICTHADGRRSSSANSHLYPQKRLPILGKTRTVIPNQRLGDHWNSIAKRGDPHAHTHMHTLVRQRQSTRVRGNASNVSAVVNATVDVEAVADGAAGSCAGDALANGERRARLPRCLGSSSPAITNDWLDARKWQSPTCVITHAIMQA